MSDNSLISNTHFTRDSSFQLPLPLPLRTLPITRIVVVFSAFYISDFIHLLCLTQVGDLMAPRISLVILLEVSDLVWAVQKPRNIRQIIQLLEYLLQCPLRVHLMPVLQVCYNLYSFYITGLIVLVIT